MSGYVDECILQIIKVTVFKSAIPILVNEVKDSKAKVVRERYYTEFHVIVIIVIILTTDV